MQTRFRQKVTVLLDPTARPDTANPVAAPSVSDARPVVPAALAPLAHRARTDRSADLALVAMLFDRHWDVDDIDAVSGLSRRQIVALAGVRRPRTASSDVADRLVARRSDLPEQRRG